MTVGNSIGAGCSIHKTAQIGRNVFLGDRVTITKGVIIYDNVSIAEDSFIGPNAIIGEPTRGFYKHWENYTNAPTSVGKKAIIRANTIIYCGVTIGDNFECGSSVSVREESRIGSDVSLGTLSDIQGYVAIGRGCRFHSNVHIGQKSEIGDFVWIFPYVVLTNDQHPPCGRCLKGPGIGDYAVIGTMSVVLPGVKVARDAVIGAMSLVTKDVPEGMVAFGVPAKVICPAAEVKCKTGFLESGHPYPWRNQFHKE